jgi:hypothetical protein
LRLNPLRRVPTRILFSESRKIRTKKISVSKKTCFISSKSIPKDAKSRQILRETWLDQKIWSWLGFKIKIVFIIAQTDHETDLAEEINEKKDLLILDFPETLYNLVYKDIAFLAFIESSCPFADLVFKGDDDILLKSVFNPFIKHFLF